MLSASISHTIKQTQLQSRGQLNSAAAVLWMKAKNTSLNTCQRHLHLASRSHSAHTGTLLNLDQTDCPALCLTESVVDCSGHRATEKILARARQLVDVKKEDGFSALHLAALNNHRDVAEILIKEVSARRIRSTRRDYVFVKVIFVPSTGALRLQHPQQPQPNASAADGDAGPHRPGAAAGGRGRRRQHGGWGRWHGHARGPPPPAAG